MGLTYDAGALIAAERDDQQMWTLHRRALAREDIPTVEVAVLAQVWRGGVRQARLARLLASCTVEAFNEPAARRVGEILGRAGTTDIADAAVVDGAIRRGDRIVTSDVDDVVRLGDALGIRLRLSRI